MTIFTNTLKRTSTLTSALLLMTGTAMADQVFADDLIVQGSACIGIDCVNGESFGFDTLRLKENNLRIKAQDTSSSASFPTTDWQITFNDSGNGGANKFSIDDIDAGRTPFTIEANSIANALYVSDAGDIGVGTATPVVEVHAVDGNSPTFRLEQNGSSGFTPQTWDLAGNETNFFLRDVTNGSRLPFRVQPNTPDQTLFMRTTGMTLNETGADYDLRVESDTDQNAFFIDGATGNVGMGTNTPGGALEVSSTDSFIFMRMTATGAANASADITYTGAGGAGELRYNIVDGDAQEMSLDADGNMTIMGQLTTAGSCSVGCDRVFDKDYNLKSLEEHNQAMWSQGYLPNVGPTPEDGPFNVSDKMGRMLNELEHAHIYIGQLNERIAVLESKLAD